MRAVRRPSVPATLAVVAVLFAAAPVLAQSKRPPLPKNPAPAKTAAQPRLPEILVGGLQVVKHDFGEDDWSARPFNSETGTKMVLVVKMAEGTGLIQINEDASSLDTFTDEKITQYAAEFESFPDVTKDGRFGAIEIESRIVPAGETTQLTAEGTLALVMATGSKPVKVANVRLENDKTFKLGTATVTLSDVSTEEGETPVQTFTLNLPRVTMNSIRAVRVMDAKGTVLEDARQTSRGYSNDDGMMGYSVPTAAKTISLEVDLWQDVREVKVPFKVTAGIALAR